MKKGQKYELCPVIIKRKYKFIKYPIERLKVSQIQNFINSHKMRCLKKKNRQRTSK